MTPESVLIHKWQRVLNAADAIYTWTEPLTLAYLAEAASHAKLAVEVGTYMGASAFVMLQANPDLHLWCVDKFMVAGTEKVTRMFLERFIKEGRCEIIVGDSERAGEMLKPQAGRIDLCFVDDGHAEDDLRRDIRCMLPLIRPGGLLCGHDFDVPHNDVARGVISTGISYSLPVPRLWAHYSK